MSPVHKICFIVLLFLAQVSVNGQGKWNRIEVPTHLFLKSLFFTDSLYGWAAGDTGVILHTSDGGKTWISQNSGTQNEISALFFLDRDQGWAASINYSVSPFGTLLLKTTNGGATGTRVTFGIPISD